MVSVRVSVRATVRVKVRFRVYLLCLFFSAKFVGAAILAAK